MKKIARNSLADLVSLCATGYNQPAAPSNAAGRRACLGLFTCLAASLLLARWTYTLS